MSSQDFRDIAVQVLLWTAYFALHSLLAAGSVKDSITARFPQWAPYYRMAYNAFALLSLLPIAWLAFHHPGPLLWAWKYPWNLFSNAAALAALTSFLLSLRDYDMREFSGIPTRKKPLDLANGHECFRISPFHRYVRHPWYAFGLVLLWTRDMPAAAFAMAAVTTGYLVIGSRLEEEKLLTQHGDAYRLYMDRVPGLIPLPWKSLSPQEAADIIQRQERTENQLDDS